MMYVVVFVTMTAQEQHKSKTILLSYRDKNAEGNKVEGDVTIFSLKKKIQRKFR